MSELYSDFEDALVALLKAAPALAQVKTVEADVRECLFSGDKLTQGFRAEEMPAINVTAELQPAAIAATAVSEVTYRIPISVLAIARAKSKKEARAKIRALAVAIEEVLNGCRRSDNGLGGNTIVSGDVTSSVVIVEEKPLHFAIGETKCEVLKVVQL